MIGVVTIGGVVHALVKATGGEVTMLNQSRVRMKLELLQRQQHSPAMEMVEED